MSLLRVPSSLLAAPFALFLVSGCAYRTPDAHIPAAMPAIAPSSLTLGEVTVVEDGKPLDAASVDDVRRDASAILLRATRERGAGALPGATRVRARVTIDERNDFASRALHQDGIAVVGLWPVGFGMIYEAETLSVDLDVETNGHVFHGHGKAEKSGSLYAPARRRALAVAIDRALADAAADRPGGDRPVR